MLSRHRFQGFSGIAAIAVGQLVSLVGSSMSNFAVTIWVWQKTGEATHVALIAAAAFAPLLLLTPVAGVLVDRWDRKLVMMVSDLAAGVASLMILVLLVVDSLNLPFIYLTVALSGGFRAFQVPAFSAAVTMMVAKKHYARASGILSMPHASSLILAPTLAAALLGPIGLVGVLAIDIVTCGCAVASLALIHVPPAPPTEDGSLSRTLGAEMLFGWGFIRERSALLALLATFSFFNFAVMIPISLLPPMILTRTGNDELILGSVQSMLGLGSLAGGLVLSVGGGPRRSVYGVLVGTVAMSLLIGVGLGLLPAVWGWYVASFSGAFVLPVISGCAQAIWQAKVPPDIQGRVFGIRRLLSQGSALPAFLVAGPLADRIFEPALMPGGSWAATFGFLVGTGPGSGYSLLFVASGLFGATAGILASLSRRLRRIDDELPDHSDASESETLATPTGESLAASDLG